MVFHIAVCGADASVRAGLQRLCMEYFSRRTDSCIVEQLPSPGALLDKDSSGALYELYLIELPTAGAAACFAAAAELRARGRKAPLAFFARTPAHAYRAYRVDAMQYFLLPLRSDDFFALMSRAVEPEYGPTIVVSTASGLRSLTYAGIEYLECTHHIVHYHLLDGKDVSSLSLRVSFAKVAEPLLADGRFFQPHRSYIVNLAAVQRLDTGEFSMRSGARVPITRGRENAARSAFKAWACMTAGADAAQNDDI